MTEYKLVSSPRLDRFEQGINALLKEGWELHSAAFISSSGAMAQGMIREATGAAPSNKPKMVKKTDAS